MPHQSRTEPVFIQRSPQETHHSDIVAIENHGDSRFLDRSVTKGDTEFGPNVTHAEDRSLGQAYLKTCLIL